jgi:hypothetical protein
MLRGTRGEPQVQEFFDRLAHTYDVAEKSEGFIGRSTLDPASGKHSWGEVVYPSFYDPTKHKAVALTLSLWDSMEAAAAFTYNGAHGEALSLRQEWFVPPEWPSHAAWWAADTHQPNWTEATEHIEHLRNHGPTAHAFTFKNPYGPSGESIQINRDLIRELTKRSQERRKKAA